MTPARRSAARRTSWDVTAWPMAWGCSTSLPPTTAPCSARFRPMRAAPFRSEEHTSELQSHSDLVCRLLLEKKKKKRDTLEKYLNKICTKNIPHTTGCSV